MNSASLLGNGLKQIWGAYERQLERHPITTQMTTSFLLWGSGDLIAQRMERWEQQQQILKQKLKQQQQQSKKKKAVKGAPPGSSELSISSSSSDADSGYDMRRAFFTALFGATFVGPVGHFWYQAIDRWCKALIPKGGPAFIATKVLIDTAAMGPFYVAGEHRNQADRTAMQIFRRTSRNACMHECMPDVSPRQQRRSEDAARECLQLACREQPRMLHGTYGPRCRPG